jgi:hypothetical protein
MYMNPNLDSATHGEITLADCVRISGILIFVALICLCIGLLAAGAKRSATIPAQEAIKSVFTETTQSKPNEKAQVHFETAVAQPKRYYVAFVSTSSQFLSQTPYQPNNRAKTEVATGNLVTSDVQRAKAIPEHHGNLVMTWKATDRRSIAHPSRRSSSLERSVSKSVRILIEMWRRSADTNKTARERREVASQHRGARSALAVHK